MSHDDITLGGIPSAEIRRAKRESGGALTDRPTQPILHALGEMPDGSPAPDVPPPDRQRALDLARAYRSGADAQRVVGRDGCEEMARWIEAQPDYVAAIDRVVAAELVAQRIVIGPDVDGDPSLREALAALADAKHRLGTLGSSPSPIGDVVGAIQAQIDEWLLATVAVVRARARDEAPSDEALARVKDAERSLAALSSLDPRFAGVLESIPRQKVIVMDSPADCDLSGVWDVLSEHPMAGGDTYLRLQQGKAHIGARRSRTRPAPSSGDQIYRCAGPSCPGLPYRASDIAHPASCAEPRTSP